MSFVERLFLFLKGPYTFGLIAVSNTPIYVIIPGQSGVIHDIDRNPFSLVISVLDTL